MCEYTDHGHCGILRDVDGDYVKACIMYAPFLDAVESTFQGVRKRYQHPVGSTSHAALAFERDVKQGADSVIVKPALFYSDIVASFAAKKVMW
ncbi:hypothetical protein PsorP6_004950 [Peronosclerospora sorghi]|uniref:Uncharacterized protein n=1 Tax=Peronosclerospora sorghi TaxID=230839 RepID=A0ACC0W3F9_9STRA|nr:hypothetical protein PsorP6_004950 [Peronosclerospora sorghi]